MITVHKRTVRRFLAAMSAGAVLSGTGIGYATHADASPMFDPHYPVPVLGWCPGGGAGSGWGSYCEGTTFPDGTRLNYFRVMGFWQGPRCIRPDGTPTPPPAPGGCGGIG